MNHAKIIERRFSVGFARFGEVMIMRSDTTALRFRDLQAHSLGTT